MGRSACAARSRPARRRSCGATPGCSRRPAATSTGSSRRADSPPRCTASAASPRRSAICRISSIAPTTTGAGPVPGRTRGRISCSSAGSSEIKGLQTVLPLWPRVAEAWDVDLLIAGTGTMEPELRGSRGDNPRIRFLGPQSQSALGRSLRPCDRVPGAVAHLRNVRHRDARGLCAQDAGDCPPAGGAAGGGGGERRRADLRHRRGAAGGDRNAGRVAGQAGAARRARLRGIRREVDPRRRICRDTSKSSQDARAEPCACVLDADSLPARVRPARTVRAPAVV